MEKIIEKIKIDTAPSYEVIVGRDILDSLGKWAGKLVKGRKAFVLTDDIVEGLYLKKAVESLMREGFEVKSFSIANGEKSKSLECFGKVIDEMASFKLTRTDALIALGGGVVGDLGGFAASSFMRGIDYIQVPTTLLSQIDSSVGGKTAIDISAGKNLVGSFYQPKLVLADIDTLSSLSRGLVLDGIGEMAKYAIMQGGDLFEIMRSGKTKENIEWLIAECIKIKRDIVSRDEKEKGDRILLNLGHTMAHSIEKLSGYEIRHGIAVGTGLYMITRASVKNGILEKKEGIQIEEMLRALGLSDCSTFSVKELAAEFSFDKKAEGERVSLVVVKKIGQLGTLKIPMTEAEVFFK